MTKRHRYVIEEPRIPFELDVVYEDAGIIVVDKPHFLATTPRGMWYRETALMRLREAYGDDAIVPAHRLDRMTAGIVVFVRDPALRGAYQMLFQERRAEKTYECLAPCAPIVRPRYGTIERLEPPRVFPLRRRSRIVKERGVLQAYETPGAVNAETVIELGSCGHPLSRPTDDSSPSKGERQGGRACSPCEGELAAEPTEGVPRVRPQRTTSVPPTLRAYTLHPRTGKTHQLRVHMNSIGLPIAGDDFYPRIRQRAYDDFGEPLALVARRLAFDDPVTGERREFVSRVPL
ncbi:pseudouridine synthase [Bifidobacterium stellenboschense]|uniref:RNA pseudouridylate synthase n=1 Tax=Bifidobacterium stellenboschense TaxID=762211 RepID=A0A087DKQ2_9BIFI|nr:pseudouridine synthase [Bifidobacterium stellenboschense]KFI96102.1 23S RNA-specific pseudouridylate synthase [Bifidobacterium stellenboschense]